MTVWKNARTWFALLSTLIVALMIASCGGAGEEAAEEGATGDNDAVATETEEGGEEESTEGLPFEGRTLSLVLKEGYEIEAIQKYIEEFEETSGATVTIEVYDEPTARQKFILDASSQTGSYDVTSVSFWHLPEYQQFLTSLDTCFGSESALFDFNADAVPASAVETLTWDGEIQALPHTIIGGMGFYRKDVFEEQGIAAPDSAEQFLAAAEQLASSDVSLSGFTGRGAPTFASLGTWLGWTWGYGAELFDENMCPQATDPTFKEGIGDLLVLMRDYGPADAASLTFTQAGEKFSGDNAAMMFDTSGFGGIFENPEISRVAGNVGFTLPVGPAGNPMQWTYIEGLGISEYSENADLACEFLKWRMSDTLTFQEMRDGRFDVPNLNVLGSEEYQQLAEERGLSEYTEKLPQSWENITIEHWPYVPEFAAIGDAFQTPLSAAIAGQISLDEAMEQAQADLEEIMQNAGYCQQ